MNADGSAERRISFGGVWYATPQWSPDGNWIAFTRRAQDGRRIGIMKPDGTGETVLTTGPGDEGPTWAASSREILFQRSDGVGRSALYRVTLDGAAPRQVALPAGASDPDWSGAID
jgi:TolB protein